jgi:hypothetical protein
VRFEPPGRGELTGIVTRYNRKTVSVVTDDGGQWTVAPTLLRPANLPTAQRVDEVPATGGEVVDLPTRGAKT